MMKITPIGTETVRTRRFHLVQKLYSFLDIPGQHPGYLSSTSSFLHSKSAQSARGDRRVVRLVQLDQSVSAGSHRVRRFGLTETYRSRWIDQVGSTPARLGETVVDGRVDLPPKGHNLSVPLGTTSPAQMAQLGVQSVVFDTVWRFQHTRAWAGARHRLGCASPIARCYPSKTKNKPAGFRWVFSRPRAPPDCSRFPEITFRFSLELPQWHESPSTKDNYQQLQSAHRAYSQTWPIRRPSPKA